RLWASSVVPLIGIGRLPGPGSMPRCVRARKRRKPDIEKKNAPPCRISSQKGALKGRALCPGRQLMAIPEPKLRDLFSKAVQFQTAQEQAAYLENACQGDTALRARLEELLQAN